MLVYNQSLPPSYLISLLYPILSILTYLPNPEKLQFFSVILFERLHSFNFIVFYVVKFMKKMKCGFWWEKHKRGVVM